MKPLSPEEREKDSGLSVAGLPARPSAGLTGGAPLEGMDSVLPIERRVIRHLCPFCRRGHSKAGSAARHIVRCYRNPAVRSCKTCDHFWPHVKGDWQTPDEPEVCADGENLRDGLPTGCAKWVLRERPA